MEVSRDIAAARGAVVAARGAGRRIAFVPTMGALHAGHMSLIEAARRDEAYVVVSIFVNPRQFGPSEDYNRYPRDHGGDLNQCESAGVSLVFLPSVDVMYTPDTVTTVHVAKLTDTLCGPQRPGHFDGVATVVAKLFNILQPDVAYFGRKDAQQLAVIRRMVRDLDIPVEIVGCPTVREADGLALSSRNRALRPTDREQARCIYRALDEAHRRIAGGERDADAVRRTIHALLEASGPIEIDYASIVDVDSMQPVARIERRVLVAIGARIGGTRLIDNVEVDPPAIDG